MLMTAGSRRLRFCAIGGGVSGLACALALEKAGHECLVFDTGRRGVGGRASSRQDHNRQPVDHGAQFIKVNGHSESEAFRQALQEWLELGIVQRWNGRVVDSRYLSKTADLKTQEDASYYIGSDELGIGSIATHLCSSLQLPPHSDTWVSPSNGIRKQSDGRWTVHSKGKQIGGVFDAVIIAHNGKCADRLTSRIPAKRINKLLQVQFSDRPHPKKMTLNSIYSLIVEIKPGVFRRDIDGLYCSSSSILDFAACQSRKYHHNQASTSEVWTLLSHPTYGKQNKQPQEHLEGTKLSKKIVSEMLNEAYRLLGETDNRCRNGVSEERIPLAAIVNTKLQLWGAGVPINRWEAEDGSGFLWDGENSIGCVGDWLKRSSISGAWESGYELAQFLSQDHADISVSKGLTGRFMPYECDNGESGALVGKVSKKRAAAKSRSQNPDARRGKQGARSQSGGRGKVGTRKSSRKASRQDRKKAPPGGHRQHNKSTNIRHAK